MAERLPHTPTQGRVDPQEPTWWLCGAGRHLVVDVAQRGPDRRVDLEARPEGQLPQALPALHALAALHERPGVPARRRPRQRGSTRSTADTAARPRADGRLARTFCLGSRTTACSMGSAPVPRSKSKAWQERGPMHAAIGQRHASGGARPHQAQQEHSLAGVLGYRVTRSAPRGGRGRVAEAQEGLHHGRLLRGRQQQLLGYLRAPACARQQAAAGARQHRGARAHACRSAASAVHKPRACPASQRPFP